MFKTGEKVWCVHLNWRGQPEVCCGIVGDNGYDCSDEIDYLEVVTDDGEWDEISSVDIIYPLAHQVFHTENEAEDCMSDLYLTAERMAQEDDRQQREAYERNNS